MSDFNKKLLEENEIENTVSVVEPKVEEKQTQVNKPTVFSVLLASIKKDANYLNNETYGRLPDMLRFLRSVYVMFGLVVVILIMTFYIGYDLLIPIVSLFMSIAAPILIIIFFYEFAVDKKVNIFVILVSFVVGFLLYVLLNFGSSFLYTFVAKEQIEQIGYPLVFGLSCFLVTVVVAGNLKTYKLQDCFLIAVSIAMGFCFTTNFVATFSKLFVFDGAITTASGTARLGAGVIISDKDFLSKNFQNLLNNWLFEYVLLPHLYGAWAVVIGFLVSYTSETRSSNRETVKSVYLLLLLVIAINVVSVWDPAVDYLSLVFKALAVFGSTMLEVVFLNLCLSKTTKSFIS